MTIDECIQQVLAQEDLAIHLGMNGFEVLEQINITRRAAPLLAKACRRMKEALEITANLIGTDTLQIKFETVWCDPKNVTSNLEQSQKNMETWFIKLRDALADVEKMFEEGK